MQEENKSWEPKKCSCGETKEDIVHRFDAPCYVEEKWERDLAKIVLERVQNKTLVELVKQFFRSELSLARQQEREEEFSRLFGIVDAEYKMLNGKITEQKPTYDEINYYEGWNACRAEILTKFKSLT